MNESPNSFNTTVRFDGMNFLAWSQSTKLYLAGKDKSTYLTVDAKMPNSKESTFAKWEVENAMVMSRLLHSLQPNIANNYLFLPTTKVIWELVTKTYSKKGNKACMYDLHQKVSQL